MDVMATHLMTTIRLDARENGPIGTASALIDPAGQVVASVRAVWVALTDRHVVSDRIVGTAALALS